MIAKIDNQLTSKVLVMNKLWTIYTSALRFI